MLVAKVIGFAISFVIPLVIVRHLSQETFGLYRMSFQLVSTATGVLTLYFGLTAFYYLAREPSMRAPAILNILVFNTCVGLFVILALGLYPRILSLIFESGGLVALANLIAVVFALSLFGLFLEVVTAANQEPTYCAAFIIGGSAVRAAAMFFAAVNFGSVESLLFAAIAVSIVQCIALAWYLRSRFPGLFSIFSPQLFASQLHYQLPYGLTSLFLLLQTDAHHYFVGKQYGEAKFAVYAVGFSLLPMLMIAREAVGLTMVPRVSELQQQGDAKEIWRITVRAIEKLALIYLPLASYLWLVAGYVLTTLYTENFRESVPIFQASLLLLLAHMVIVDPITRAYKELGRVVLAITIGTSMAIVALLAAFSNDLSLRGIALVVVGPQLVQTLMISIVAARRIGVQRDDLRALLPVARMALAAGLCALVVHFAMHLSSAFVEELVPSTTIANLVILATAAIIFAIGYALLAMALGFVDSDDVAQVKSILSRIGWRRAMRQSNGPS